MPYNQIDYVKRALNNMKSELEDLTLTDEVESLIETFETLKSEVEELIDVTGNLSAKLEDEGEY